MKLSYSKLWPFSENAKPSLNPKLQSPEVNLLMSMGSSPRMRRSPRSGLNARGSPPRVRLHLHPDHPSSPSWEGLRPLGAGYAETVDILRSLLLGGSWEHFGHFFRFFSLLGTS